MDKITKVRIFLSLALIMAIALIGVLYSLGGHRSVEANTPNDTEEVITTETSKIKNIDEVSANVDIQTEANTKTDEITNNTMPTASQPTMSNEEVAKAVIHGDYGVGDARKEALSKAGYDYETIQAIVNKTFAPVIKVSSHTTQNNSQPNATPSSNTCAVEQSSASSCLGTFKITGYGSFEPGLNNMTASGVTLVPGVSCAMNNAQRKALGINYGDYIYIEGIGARRVDDCGCSYGVVDVAVSSYSEMYAITRYARVYR